MAPVMLFGAQTAVFGAAGEGAMAANNWRKQRVGSSLHCVLEASEPSIGMRLLCDEIYS